MKPKLLWVLIIMITFMPILSNAASKSKENFKRSQGINREAKKLKKASFRKKWKAKREKPKHISKDANIDYYELDNENLLIIVDEPIEKNTLTYGSEGTAQAFLMSSTTSKYHSYNSSFYVWCSNYDCTRGWQEALSISLSGYCMYNGSNVSASVNQSSYREAAYFSPYYVNSHDYGVKNIYTGTRKDPTIYSRINLKNSLSKYGLNVFPDTIVESRISCLADQSALKMRLLY